MNITLPEGIIIAVLTGLVSIWGAIITARAQSRTATKEMFSELSEAQQKRIKQLTDRLTVVEDELRQARADNDHLRERVNALECERIDLLTQIAKLQAVRS